MGRIVPRLVTKNGVEQWKVMLPKDLAGSGNPKRRYFPDEASARQYADELMGDRGTLASYFHRLSIPHQEIVARLIARVNFDAVELERLVNVGAKQTPGSSVTVADAVRDFMVIQRTNGVGDHMMRNYAATVEKQFAERFTGAVSEIRSPAVDDWLRTFTDPRTRNNKRGHVLTFLRWLQARDYVAHDVQWRLTRAIEPARDISILTPDQMRKLLECVRGDHRPGHRRESLLPFIAIGAFAGLRSAEVMRLQWEDIHLDRGFIFVSASIVKRVRNTLSRTVPIQPNLKAILTPLVRKGPVCPNERMAEVLIRVASQAGIDWQKNALRHSYTSYRVASGINEAQVATEIGDLVGTMKRHYKQAIDPALGAKWFSIS